jgi:beta-lactamase superfamily II metal-dependent hydrolase
MSDKLQVRTVRVELLRSGPPHNQLLSPLTPYLGICGDSPAGVVHVPYEHAVFERRLADLRYTGISDMRLAQLRDTGVDMGRMLAAVPGLPGSVSSELQSQAAMIHLRVTLSASELALLPFELSKVPITADGESEAWLALQTKPPVCITRHIRTVSSEGVTWPSRARILFVAGAAGDIPFDAHRRALEQAIAPYCYPRRDDPVEGLDARHVHYGDLLTIIEDASLDDLVTAFRSARYTHVHVLAHGAIDFSSKGKPFGIRLRGRNGGIDVVSGERFATALARVDNDRVHRPFVVTLASCDSGLVANVVEPAPGASFAHTLHQSGIPLVVGSQFPLTKDGSVTVVELFYNGMLRGANPHVLAHQTRSELHSRYGADTHDWASLVVYEALPTNMDAQLERVCYEQGRLRLNAALERVDIAVSEARQNLRTADNFDALEADVQNAIAALPDDGAYSIECRGLRASAMKRVAQATFVGMSGEDTHQLSRTCDRLEDALSTYRAASEMFLRNDASVVQRMATLHWVAVQHLVMQAVLRQPLSEEVLAVASHAATLYLDHPSREERAWAHASLAELSLLRLAMGGSGAAADAHAARIREHLEKIIGMFPAEQRFELSSTAKQFRRYVDWWGAATFERFVDARQVHGKAQPWADTARVVAEAEKAAHLLTASIPRKQAAAAPAAARTTHEDAAQPSSPSAGTLGRPAGKKRRARPAENAFLDVQMLPADWGDCLWIEYGTDPRRPSRVLVDCGTRGTGARLLSRIDALPEADRQVELFILTHIDDDHIGGAIPFLEAELGGLKVQDVWFNGYKHLAQFLGAEQGERFSSLIVRNGLPWNKWMDGKAIVIEGDTLPEHTLPGGMKLTLLSPTVEKLDALRLRWEQELRVKNLQPGAGVDPGQLMGADRDDLLGADDHGDSTDVDAMAALPFKSDEAAPNGSSIAVLAEFEGKSILLGADAHPPVLEASIRRLLDARGGEQLTVGALKVSHHGSHGNTSPELLALLDCRQFLISTNGKKFNHPHRPTISRIIKSGPHPQLSFNYVSKDKNDVWAREDLQDRYKYSATYPQGPQGLVIRL